MSFFPESVGRNEKCDIAVYFVGDSRGCRSHSSHHGFGTRTAKLIKGARLLVVKDGPHCIPWTHAEEVNADPLSFLGEKAGKSQKEAAQATNL
jgi:hypothetical protein